MLARTFVPILISAAMLGGAPAAYATGLGERFMPVHGSGNLKTEQRQPGDFDSVNVEGATDVEVSIGPQASVTVQADDNILPLVRTRVVGHTLVVDEKGNWIGGHDPLVRVVVPRLDALKIEGSGDASLRGMSGSSLSLVIEGSGDIGADGAVQELDLRIEGSGDARLSHLQAEAAEVLIEGSGNADVAAAKSLKGVIDGSGDLSYRGDPPLLSTRVDGSGDIIHKK
jgi:putative autotransporter adhesin-like protein